MEENRIGIVKKIVPDTLGFMVITWNVEPVECPRCDLCKKGCSGEVVGGKTVIDNLEVYARRTAGQSLEVACDILNNI